ncbi:hypothetical protein [Streptomyces sp. NPDC057838]|uniref:hypothetical protein n=1 Tax=unclassified Streptomyces TaxID=2593676 RepID=UPI0036D1FD88
MVMVTGEDLQRVEDEAARAQEALREAERGYAANRASRAAYDRHRDAVDAADHAAVRARLMREEWEAQEAVRRRRAAEGEAAAEEMAGEVEGLAASRAVAVAAVVEAEVALGRALEALAAHDGLVRKVGEQLAGRGLRVTDGEATGAGLDGSAWVGGTLWPLVDGGSVLGRLLVEVVAGQDGRHPMARLVWQPYGGATAGRGRDEVLAAVRAVRGR